MNGWTVALVAYVATALITFIPTFRVLVSMVELKPGGPSFDESTSFSPEAKKRLNQNVQRISGTLTFWKTQAEKYRRFHRYSLVWVTISAVSVPILAQAITADPASTALVTVVSVHSALLLALSRVFRVEANYRNFRNGESEYYDLYRRMLDRPDTFGDTEEERLARYFEQVELVRKIIRSAETDNMPTIEDVTTQK